MRRYISWLMLTLGSGADRMAKALRFPAAPWYLLEHCAGWRGRHPGYLTQAVGMLCGEARVLKSYLPETSHELSDRAISELPPIDVWHIRLCCPSRCGPVPPERCRFRFAAPPRSSQSRFAFLGLEDSTLQNVETERRWHAPEETAISTYTRKRPREQSAGCRLRCRWFRRDFPERTS